MKKRKNCFDILHVSTHYPPDIGGLEIALEKMVNSQILTNKKICVLTGKNKNKNYINSKYVKRFNRYEAIRGIFIIPRLYFYLLKTRSNIYFIHYGLPTIPEIGFLISKIKSSFSIIFIHLILEGTKPITKFLFNIYHKTIIRFILRRTDVIIVPTRSYKLHISKKFGLDSRKIATILYGVELEEFSSKIRKSHTNFNILFVGNLKIQKNVPLLINAFDILATKYNDMHLNIIGSGMEENNLKELASKKKNRKRIHFIGEVPNRELPEFYMDADLFVLPSLNESAGIVILEAFASKVPVVATKCLGVIDLIGKEREILVKNNDVSSLVEGIEKLYLNKLNVKIMVNKAYEFLKKHTWKKMNEKINLVLNKIYD